MDKIDGLAREVDRAVADPTPERLRRLKEALQGPMHEALAQIPKDMGTVKRLKELEARVTKAQRQLEKPHRR